MVSAINEACWKIYLIALFNILEKADVSLAINPQQKQAPKIPRRWEQAGRGAVVAVDVEL